VSYKYRIAFPTSFWKIFTTSCIEILCWNSIDGFDRLHFYISGV